MCESKHRQHSALESKLAGRVQKVADTDLRGHAMGPRRLPTGSSRRLDRRRPTWFDRTSRIPDCKHAYDQNIRGEQTRFGELAAEKTS